MYVLDENVFINAHRMYYDFDIVPSFWNSLLTQAVNNKIRSIDKVKDEIIFPNDKSPDKLHLWSDQNFRAYFEQTNSQDVINAYGEIQQWALTQSKFTDSAKDEFARNADAWLIAYAKAKNYTIVTLETYNAEARKRILIPVVCEEFHVPYVTTFEMLKSLRVCI